MNKIISTDNSLADDIVAENNEFDIRRLRKACDPLETMK